MNKLLTINSLKRADWQKEEIVSMPAQIHNGFDILL